MDVTIDEMISLLTEWREKSGHGGETKVRMGLSSYRCAPAVDFQDSSMLTTSEEGSTLWLAVGSADDYCPNIWDRSGEIISSSEEDSSEDDDTDNEGWDMDFESEASES